MVTVLLLLFAYLLGSVPIGYVLGAVSGVDVRKSGSGNVGATNVARVVGKTQGLLTLIGDAAKGFIPVYLCYSLGFNSAITSMVGAAAFLGHLYPVFLKFQGGKGVATALGIFLALGPLVTGILLAVFLAVALVSRIVSLASIAAAAVAPLSFWLLGHPPDIVGLSLGMALMVIFRHRGNIQRLLAGAEPRFRLSSQ